MHLRAPVIQGKPSTYLRQMLQKDEPIMGVWGATAHHAQLAEAAGFKFFGISGSQSSAHILGMPDVGLATMTEVVDNIRNICNAVSIPVFADADTGFGNAINVVRTVREFIKAGAAGFFLEDQVSPKRCGFTKGVDVISLEESVGKLRAALDTRDQLDPDVVIQARTDVRSSPGGSVSEVLRRCDAYLNAGADMLLVMGLQTREEVLEVRRAFPGAKIEIIAHALQPELSTAETRELNLAMYSMPITKVGQIAMFDFLQRFKAEGPDAYNEFQEANKNHPLVGFGFLDLTGFSTVSSLEDKYLGEQAAERRKATLGVFDPTSKDDRLSGR